MDRNLGPCSSCELVWRGRYGGIPARTTICSTLSPGVTVAQSTQQSPRAPTTRSSSLNAGAYSLSGMIDFAGRSNVTLRGAGASSTLITWLAEIAVERARTFVLRVAVTIKVDRATRRTGRRDMHRAPPQSHLAARLV